MFFLTAQVGSKPHSQFAKVASGRAASDIALPAFASLRYASNTFVNQILQNQPNHIRPQSLMISTKAGLRSTMLSQSTSDRKNSTGHQLSIRLILSLLNWTLNRSGSHTSSQQLRLAAVTGSASLRSRR